MTAEPQPGDYFCVPAGGRFRHAVKLGQWLMGDGWSQLGHCGIYVGNGLVIEAVRGHGVAYDSLCNFLDEPSWSAFELEHWQRRTIVRAAETMDRAGYWDWNAVGMLLRRLGAPADFLYDQDRPLCSQFVAACYWAADVVLAGPGRSYMDVTPARLHRLALASQTERALAA